MIKGRAVQYLTAIAVSLGTASMGTFSGWPTPVIPKMHHNETSFLVTKGEIGWVLASTAPGFMSGSLATRFVSDSLGRRTALIASALPMFVGTMLVANAINTSMLYATKFFWGFGTGMISTVLSIYLAEISDKDLRASLSMVTRFTFNFGVLLVMCIGPFMTFEFLNWLLLVLPICYFVASLWIPESPYYLLKTENVDRARDELSRLRGIQGEELEASLKEMQADVKKEIQKSSSVWELFSGRQYRRAIVIAAGLKIPQILTGIVTIQQYLGLIVKEGRMSMSEPTALIVFAAVRFIVSFMSSFFVDRVGRVTLLLYSYLGTGLSLAIVGIYFYFQSDGHSEPWLQVFSYIAFITIILANVISTVGFNSITSVVHAEIFPLNVKDVAMTSLNIFGGCLSMVVSKGYDRIKDVAGLCGVFWCFAVMAFVGALFSGLMVPETRGKGLKEIQVMLQGDLYDAGESRDDGGISLIEKTENIELNGDCELKELNAKRLAA